MGSDGSEEHFLGARAALGVQAKIAALPPIPEPAILAACEASEFQNYLYDYSLCHRAIRDIFAAMKDKAALNTASCLYVTITITSIRFLISEARFFFFCIGILSGTLKPNISEFF